ncbi:MULTISPECIES: hypothetical protein [Oceanobacillus]|uniref:Uncharacterized protein n=1 Tax=Oceanobacillus kimchii TaxID=746691 RepID=A0ABQ5TNY2_9BACI|nr:MULTISPECIES: hypothetical protein [Oceanobacillus]MBT2600430.1 hypothetical protein [Oceanobacillus sp. ISL-74]MBT2650588.1 hypothetical protein [Oceanobacillus sp. ISL-73]MCT1578328.1 hypothetical protein [Oceanobacillus kimchii]MCT2134506.1 hypothetical protein [Oceanobacillus kimchii]OEH54872.1 hypothetical protein AQ616_07425 [Oceanobacillus sp. E9]
MNNQYQEKIFSIGSGIKSFVKLNIVLFLIVLMFFINYFAWNDDSKVSIFIFIIFAEPFIILYSTINCFKPYEKIKKIEFDKEQPKEWIALSIVIIFLSLFSLIFLGANIPYPSTIIFLILMTNFMVALYSVFFHPVAIGFYEANVYSEKSTVFDYIFKYIAIFFSGINYYVQITLLKLPLFINKLIAIVFVLLLLWQAFGVIGLFE